MDTKDQRTADAFAESWNHLPTGSVYTREQFEDWMAPITKADAAGKRVLELGCGNGSLLVHMAAWKPARLLGVDLGDSVASATRNMQQSGFSDWEVRKADLTAYRSVGFDLVYCIGVLHHLKDPKAGVESLIRNTKPGGRFHAWVYAKEGNGVIRFLVDPLRKLVCHFPWWFTKYAVATPLSVPYYLYAKTLRVLRRWSFLSVLPLYQYSLWIATREFSFFRHVAFDQLVTPQTMYVSRALIEEWLASFPEVDRSSIYITMRNGNSWRFGGTRSS
jgi:SAM-dependent methyltransferase